MYYGWVPLVTGITLLHGLQVIVVLQALVLVPLVLVLVWAVADRLFGRTYAAVASSLWAFGPLLMLAGLTSRYRPSFEQYFLVPHWAGLTNMADLPSVAAVLACAWATLRAADTGRTDDAVVAGVLGGVMIGLKPANGFFIPAVAVLLVAAWRPKVAAGFAAGIVPALITLALWKARGLGHLPITHAYASTREAAGPLAATPSHYIPFDLHRLNQQLIDLKEVFWSLRLLEFLAIAGSLAAIRRVPAKGAFVVVWFAGFCLVKGSSNLASVPSTSYFRFVEPGLPAFVLLIASLGFLVPVHGRRVPWRRAAESWSVRRSPGLIAAGLAALVPLAVIVAAHPARTMRFARNNLNATEAPISSDFALTAAARGDSVRLDWKPRERAGLDEGQLPDPALDRRRRLRAASPGRCRVLRHRQPGVVLAPPVLRRPAAARPPLRLPRRAGRRLPRLADHDRPDAAQLAGVRDGRLTGSRSPRLASSSASRCASTTFWSESREITVE